MRIKVGDIRRLVQNAMTDQPTHRLVYLRGNRWIGAYQGSYEKTLGFAQDLVRGGRDPEHVNIISLATGRPVSWYSKR